MNEGEQAGVDRARVEDLAAEIAQRGREVRARIEAAARGPVEVVAVTKGHPPEIAAAALLAGYRTLGENYAQELRQKAAILAACDWLPAAEWHFVGRLQSNKVRLMADAVSVWQSLDRPSAIDAVAKRCEGARVMVQVDLAGMEGRGGCDRAEVAGLVEHARGAGLDVIGLMGVGPPGDPEDSREGFDWLAREAATLGLSEVSMGMSADLEVAVEQGATMVRVGSALVGARPPR